LSRVTPGPPTLTDWSQRPASSACEATSFLDLTFDTDARISGQIVFRLFQRYLRRADGRSRRISLKNPLLRRARWASAAAVSDAKLGSAPHAAKIGAGKGMSFVSFRKFWAVAANRNSSLAPLGPRRRNRSSLRMRFRSSMSVSAPFVWRCLSGSTIAPFPHPAHRTGRADFPHPALGQDLTPSFACNAIGSF